MLLKHERRKIKSELYPKCIFTCKLINKVSWEETVIKKFLLSIRLFSRRSSLFAQFIIIYLESIFYQHFFYELVLDAFLTSLEIYHIQRCVLVRIL